MKGHSLKDGRLIPEGDCLLVITDRELQGFSHIPAAILEWVEADKRHQPACKAYFESDWLYGSIAVPNKEAPEAQKTALYYVLNREKLILVERHGDIAPYLNLIKGQKHQYASVSDLFLTFLEKLMYEDFFFICGVEEALGGLEEAVIQGAENSVNQELTKYRRRLVLFHSYYGQLVAIGERLEDEGFFSETSQLHAFLDKARRLDAKTETLTDYCAHIRDSFQAETGMRMNRTMQTLTVITVLFMPVSVVSAWYGMNFANMPELGAPMGYLATVGITLVLTISAILYCKYKKLF